MNGSLLREGKTHRSSAFPVQKRKSKRLQKKGRVVLVAGDPFHTPSICLICCGKTKKRLVVAPDYVFATP
jgi:hypothetical protein